ncbi:DNA polymerase III subunit beta [Streptosporangium saharense]|uniref:DNA polymerase III subunit beta n=1 Tax=Streptosporangium saharense TaxID=1706840 RepID=UPI00342C751C
MKISLSRDALADAVAWTAHALTPRPSVPALAGLLLEAGDGLTVSAFDYDTSRRARISADVHHPDRVLLPGRVLVEVAKALPKGGKPVEIVTDGSEAVLTCGSAEFGLPAMPVEDYPTLPKTPPTAGVVDAATFASAVSQVAPATTRDETIPMLTGVRVDSASHQLTLAATDRYRIAARTLPWTPHTAAHAMIPGKVLADIAKSLPPGDVTIGLGDGLAGFESLGRSTTVRLLDEQFIDYRARLTADWPIHADVAVAPLIAAVKRVALVADKNTAIRLTFRQGQALIQAGGGDIGRGTEVLEAELTGGDIEIAFQSQFLLDGLTGIAGERVRVHMTAPAKPALLTEADDPAFRYLVMALRLS